MRTSNAFAMRPAALAAPAALVALAALVTGSGCKNRFEAKIDGVLLSEADSGLELTADEAKAPKVIVRAEPSVPDEELPMPASGPVQLVIERAVPWARVEALLATIESKKLSPILMVGKTHRVRRFQLNDALTEGKPRFTLTGDAKGKFCVQTAQLPKAYCVSGRPIAGNHIHGAFVRETVRDVVKKWEMTEAMAYLDPAMEWADVLRLIDGARTCCGKKATVLVQVSHEAPLGPDAEAGNPAIIEQARKAAAAEGQELEGDEAATPVESAEPGTATGTATATGSGTATGTASGTATGSGSGSATK